MPRNHRAGRRVQLRRLAARYISAPAEQFNLLGVPGTPCEREESSPASHGIVVVCGDWAPPRQNPASEINGIPTGPIEWRLISIDLPASRVNEGN